jgi:hypothetical protein
VTRASPSLDQVFRHRLWNVHALHIELRIGKNTLASIEGERFHASPQVSEKWVRSLPYRDVPTEYIVFKPLQQVTDQEQVSLIVFSSTQISSRPW